LATLILVFLTAPAPTEIYSLSLHDALPISLGRRPRSGAARRPHARLRSGPCRPEAVPPAARCRGRRRCARGAAAHRRAGRGLARSEEHTSELQSLTNLVCRLLLEKKKQQNS